jgi:hypothetical protein
VELLCDSGGYRLSTWGGAVERKGEVDIGRWNCKSVKLSDRSHRWMVSAGWERVWELFKAIIHV